VIVNLHFELLDECAANSFLKSCCGTRTRVSVAVRLCKAFPILDTTFTLCAVLNFSRFLWPCLTNS
jgi:hypothetical protein